MVNYLGSQCNNESSFKNHFITILNIIAYSDINLIIKKENLKLDEHLPCKSALKIHLWKGANTQKAIKGIDIEAFFQGLHLTLGIPMLVYLINFYIFHI